MAEPIPDFDAWLAEWRHHGGWQVTGDEVDMLLGEIDRLRHALGQPVPYTIIVDGREVEVPAGAVAWRHASGGGWWLYTRDSALRVESVDPDAIVWAH
jgi:hypothetical protein